jgi:very-short-patch-repair endonuclease
MHANPAEDSHARPEMAVVRPSRERSCSGSLLHDIASRQHGVVTRAQLAEAGMSRPRMDNLLRSGRLERLYPSVYRCTLTEATEWTRASAAALAAAGVYGWRDERGRITVAVSHRMAAELRSYLPPPGEAGGWLVDVSGQPIRRTPGVQVHQTLLAPGDAVLLKGIPVTSPARTILDVAGDVSGRELEQALAVAERMRRKVRDELAEQLRMHPRHRGSGALRRLLAALAASGTAPLYLRSTAEQAAWELILELGLPLPLVNHRLLSFEVDFHWPELRLVLEVDGFAFHGGLEPFHRDRERDRALALAGYQVLRFTWRQLDRDRVRTAGALAAAIARREELLRRR